MIASCARDCHLYLNSPLPGAHTFYTAVSPSTGEASPSDIFPCECTSRCTMRCVFRLEVGRLADSQSNVHSGSNFQIEHVCGRIKVCREPGCTFPAHQSRLKVHSIQCTNCSQQNRLSEEFSNAHPRLVRAGSTRNCQCALRSTIRS